MKPTTSSFSGGVDEGAKVVVLGVQKIDRPKGPYRFVTVVLKRHGEA